MNEELLTLPIGIQSFDTLRKEGYLYVDKTAKLLELVKTSGRCFLSRPRRFGKSLTLSTLDAMFSGKVELFRGLAAENWVKAQAEHPAPVLRFDMSMMKSDSANGLEQTLMETIDRLAWELNLTLPSKTVEGKFQDILLNLSKRDGKVVVLIDEYDKPMLDNIGNPDMADAVRKVLRSFYTVLKGCDEYLRFVMLTGISKFSKTGVFSAMNNLQDISMNRRYGDIVGYTQTELEEDFAGWIMDVATALSLNKGELLEKIRNYYDGFCFDGNTRLYNPFSILNFFSEQEFRNYWYTSGSPSFIVAYMKQHEIKTPEKYRHIEVTESFTDAQEIERARPESFLYQSGYLTIERKEEQALILDYPNREVLDSLSRMYLEHVYHVESYGALGSQIWKSLKGHDIAKVVELYNVALAGIPYDDYADQGESWYRSLFLMLLRGAGITANGGLSEVPRTSSMHSRPSQRRESDDSRELARLADVHTNMGRPDVVAQFPEQVIVLEFKYAKDSSEIDSKRAEGERQIQEKNYVMPYEGERRQITTAVIVIDGETRKAVL